MFKQMQYFISVVNTQSFTKAAEECYISQSAISQQIKALEKQLDVQLLIRENRSFTLTPAGKYFYEHCKKVIQEVDILCKNTKAVEEDENILSIGYLRGYEGKEFQEALIEFSSIYPDVSIQVRRGNHEELYKSLINGEISLVISEQRRVFHEDYINYHLLHMDCYIEISNNHLLSKQDTIDVAELSNSTCVLVATKQQQEIEQTFYQNSIGLKCHYLFANDIEEARLLVSINSGFMPIEHVKRPTTLSASSKTIPLYKNNKQLQRNYCAFWKKDRTNYYIEEFAELLRNKIRKHHDE